MDRMRTRRRIRKSQPSMAPKATREEFKPAVDWTEDSSNRLLHMQLPGFKREDVTVQVDHNAGKVLIKGSRQASDNKYIDVAQSFDVPEDTITENISERFEGGRLTLIMPKKVVEEQEATRQGEEEEKEAISEEKPCTDEGKKKEEEAIEDKRAEPFEEPTSTEEKKDEPIKEKPWSREEKKDEPMHEKKPTTEEKKDELSQKEKPSAMEREKELEKVEEEKEEYSSETEMAKSSAMVREKEDEPIQLMESKTKEICADKTRRMSAWRGAEDSWLVSGLFNYGILEKLNRNKKVIAVAVVAFSVGFFVSQKLGTWGK